MKLLKERAFPKEVGSGIFCSFKSPFDLGSSRVKRELAILKSIDITGQCKNCDFPGALVIIDFIQSNYETSYILRGQSKNIHKDVAGKVSQLADMHDSALKSFHCFAKDVGIDAEVLAGIIECTTPELFTEGATTLVSDCFDKAIICV